MQERETLNLKSAYEAADMSYVAIQHQTSAGNWTTVQQVLNDPHNIRNGLESAKSMYPESRIRAIDASGRLVDML